MSLENGDQVMKTKSWMCVLGGEDEAAEFLEVCIDEKAVLRV
jgi:hypothetical protein